MYVVLCLVRDVRSTNEVLCVCVGSVLEQRAAVEAEQVAGAPPAEARTEQSALAAPAAPAGDTLPQLAPYPSPSSMLLLQTQVSHTHTSYLDLFTKEHQQ